MTVLFDTSVLIASMVESHVKHDLAFHWLTQANDKEIRAIIAAHTLLEIYSVLTSAPFKPPIPPQIAQNLITKNIKKNFEIISLTAEEYIELLDKLADINLIGGIVYDALIMHCAQKAGAEKIVTANRKDFMRLNRDNHIEIVAI